MKKFEKLFGSWFVWRKRISASLASIVVFVTVYSLVLPAITLDQDTADQDEGIGEEVFDDYSEDEFRPEDPEPEDIETDAIEEGALETSLWPVTLEWPDARTREALKKAAETAAEIEKIDYTVTASFDEEAELPADVTFQAVEIAKDEDQYGDYYEWALDAVRKEVGEEAQISYARFFDIAFLDGGYEVEPEDSVSIVIEYDDEKELKAEESEDISIVHFDWEDPENPVFMENVEITETDGHVESICFESGTFSVYGVVKTSVGEMAEETAEEGEQNSFSHSLMGGESIMLSELLETACPDHEELQIGNVIDVAAGDTVSESKASGNEDFLQISYDVETGDYEITASPEQGNIEGKESAVTVLYGDESAAVFEIDVAGVAEVDAGLAKISTADGIYLPDSAEGSVEELAAEDISPSAESVADTGGNETVSRVFDISLNLTPEEQAAYEGGFQVSLTLPEEVTGRDFRLYHIHDGITEELDIVKTGSSPDENGLQTVSGIQFVTESFSEFILQYTVDFHWEADGETYECGIPGGGYSRLSDIVRLLGLASDDPETGEDEVRLFMQDVADVTFSAPELLWVGKVEQDTTVRALKDAYGLVCEYSGELTSHDIWRIDEAAFEPVDWALISLKPFASLETLTVSMEDGSVYTIKVTDGQIVKMHIDDSGDTWRITVIYGEDAEIPEGAELAVDELLPGSPEYEEHYARAMAELGVADTTPVEADAAAAEAAALIETVPVNENGAEGIRVSLPLAESQPGKSVEYARFFDIRIMYNGNQIEPKAPVIVKAEYTDMPEMEDGDTVTAVHFSESGVELIDTDTAEEILFEQGSFSVTGTVVTSDQNWSNLSNGKYVMYVSSGGKTYAVKHDRSLTEVTVSNGKLTFPTFTALSDVDEYLWDYQASYSGGYGGSWRHYLSYTTGGTRYYIDPRAANDISTTQRDLTRTGDNKIHSNNNYLGVSGGNIVGQQSSGNGVQIQFANAFQVDVERYVTVHFVDRAGNPLTGVNYTGGNPAVTPNDDGTYKILYNWHGGTGSVKLNSDFTKPGYTYANSHLAGVRQGTALTYNGLVIDAELVENGNTLKYSTDNGNEGAGTGNLKFNPLKSFDLNAAMQVYYTNNNGTASLGDYSPANAESKDIYVILDPVRAGSGGTGTGTGGTGSGSGTPGGDIDVNDPDFLKTMEPNGDGTYTISLSVTGKAKNQTLNPKANVVLVLDTSSSMDGGVSGSNKTRLEVMKDALTGQNGISTELFANNGTNGRDDDTVEVAMITFDGGVVTGNTWMKTKAAFDGAVNGITPASLHRGTDWEDALKEAHALAAAKMNEPGHEGEATFVIFFTDGEPSQYTQFHGAGDYNENNPNHDESGYRIWYSYFLSREAAKDEARAIVNDGIRLYGIFAFNSGGQYAATGETGSDLLSNTIGYAYNMSSVPNDTYFYNAGSAGALTTALQKILKSITESVGIQNVKMHDDITSLTSVGISVSGEGEDAQYSGFRYTRSGGTYGIGQTWNEAPKAKFTDANGEKYVEWDIGAASSLEDGVTYTVSFTVWPSQDAYDLVADLNNGLKQYENLTAAEKKQVIENPEGSGKYELKTNPSSAEGNNEISYDKVLTEILDELPNGVTPGEEIVDGNTTTVYTENEDGTYTKTVTTHKETAFNDPEKNMELKDTISKVVKKWISDLQLRQLVEYLYDSKTGESKEVRIPFVLNKGEEIYGETIWLGWDQEGPGTGYTWSDATQQVPVGDNTYTIGTEWSQPFDIAVGLLLDHDSAVARGLDLNDTTKYTAIDYNGQTMYMLEPGHDYFINEPAVAALLGYRFDFYTMVYHPMLVNGTLKSVTIENGRVTDIYPGGTASLQSLVGENTLRGGINLHKIIWDENGDPVPDDEVVDDEFTFTIELTNTSVIQEKTLADNGVDWIETEHTVFVGEDIPWYSVNGMYYHDDEGNYYETAGEGRTGNIMDTSAGGTKASITLSIKRTDTVRIANVPVGTTFLITETNRGEYDFIKATRGVSGTTVYDKTVQAPAGPVMDGEIVPNKEMNVAFVNQKPDTFHVNILKKNADSDEALPGAVFALYGDDYYVKNDQGVPTTTVNQEAQPIRQNLTSGANGQFELGDLISGTYYLVETDAPAGFLLTPPIMITVDKHSTITKTVNGQQVPLYVTYNQEGYSGSFDYSGIDVTVETENNRNIYSYTLTVVNSAGTTLPNTGGPGTRLFTILGSILILGAGVLLWRRRRLI